YTNEKLPSAKTRPGAVGDWIARARNPDWRPPAKDEIHYRQQFKTWYNAIQPDWRTLEDSEGYKWIRADSDGTRDWSDLSRSGQNGVMNVVAALFFWYSIISDTPVDKFREQQ
ncbi:hypothetical protein K435DRAFT_563020, partial [Dendrothele bispora CBS 962.96]